MSSRPLRCGNCGNTNPDNFYLNKSKRFCKSCISVLAKASRSFAKSEEKNKSKAAENEANLEILRRVILESMNRMQSEIWDVVRENYIRKNEVDEMLKNYVAKEEMSETIKVNSEIISSQSKEIDYLKTRLNQVIEYLSDLNLHESIRQLQEASKQRR